MIDIHLVHSPLLDEHLLRLHALPQLQNPVLAVS